MVVILDRRNPSSTLGIRVEGELDHPPMLMIPIGGGSYFLACDWGWEGYVQIDSTGGVVSVPDFDDTHRRLFERGRFSDQIIVSN